GEPLHVQQTAQIRAFRAAWKEAGHARTPRVSVSRSIFALIDDRDRAYFGTGAEEHDSIRYIHGDIPAVFGRGYAAEPDILIEQLRKDEAIAEADTLLLTIPNQLGVDYNAHVMEAILTTVWLARNLAVDPFHSIGGSKWQAPRERLVQSDAQGVEIAARINRAIHPTGLFGGHIGEGARND